MCVSGWKYVRPYRLASADETRCRQLLLPKNKRKKKNRKKENAKKLVTEREKTGREGGRAQHVNFDSFAALRFHSAFKKSISMKLYFYPLLSSPPENRIHKCSCSRTMQFVHVANQLFNLIETLRNVDTAKLSRGVARVDRSI